jgi:hypothetical protein
VELSASLWFQLDVVGLRGCLDRDRTGGQYRSSLSTAK